MIINKIKFTQLRNEAHYEFLVVFNSLLNKFAAVRSLVNAFLTTFTQLLEKEKQLVDAAKKSPLTEKLAEADRRIDRDVTAIREAIRSAMHHFNASIAEAAKQLNVRLKDFGNIREKPYEEESAAVQVLVSDLQTKFASQVSTVGLGPWVSELNDAEAAFTALYLQRNAELAALPQENMAQVRKDIEDVYEKMITTVQNSLNTTGEATSGQFARELNEAIRYANEHAHHRTRLDIAGATVLSIPDQPYTGRQVIVIPNVWYEHVPLILATDFNVSFADNIQPGNARLTVRGIGNYKGSKTVTFNIVVAPVPVAPDAAEATLSEPEAE